jgi:hypothetical protein
MLRTLVGMVMVCGALLSGCSGSTEDDAQGLAVSEEGLLSGTCGTTSATPAACRGKAYYSSPDGNATYCDPIPWNLPVCGQVPAYYCSYESTYGCQAEHTLSTCGSNLKCHAVPGYNPRNPPCGCE